MKNSKNFFGLVSIEKNLKLKYAIGITNFEKDNVISIQNIFDIEIFPEFLSFFIDLTINEYNNYIDNIISIFTAR